MDGRNTSGRVWACVITDKSKRFNWTFFIGDQCSGRPDIEIR